MYGKLSLGWLGFKDLTDTKSVLNNTIVYGKLGLGWVGFRDLTVTEIELRNTSVYNDGFMVS